MTKNRFLAALNRRLRPLRREDRRRLIEYYAEMIDDRVEEGKPEADVIRDLGTPRAVAAGMLSSSLQKRQSRGKIGWILALSPVWVALCAAYFCVILALWASAIGGAAMGVYVLFEGKTALASAFLGAALILMGLGMLAWRGTKAAILLKRRSRRARIGEEK